MKSLIDSYKQFVVDELRSIQPKNKWKVVVLDRLSRKLIEHVMPLSGFYDESVTDVQMIENVRDPNTSFEAVYFLTARPEVIKCVLHDFRPGHELYAAAHLFFLNAAEDSLVDKLGSIGKHVGTLKELYLDFTPQESQVFTTHDQDSPVILYNPDCGPLVETHIKEMANKIVCMCIMLGEYPMIRYYRAMGAQHPAKSLSAKLANTVQAELDNHARSNESFPPKSERPRGVLLITDRSMDLNAPLIHEFTFQAMANDLLPIREGCFYEYEVDNGKGREKVQEVISEKDSAWLNVRHMHMSLAIDRLVEEFNKFMKDNAAFNSEEKTTSLNTISNMLAGMDSYTQGKDKYSLYINIAQQCMGIFEKTNLPATGQIEQNCATGLTPLGKPPKGILEAMIPLLDDESVPVVDRARMLMIYIIYKRGIFPDDRSKLTKHARISTVLQEAIINLDLLGVPSTKDDRNKRSKPDRRSTPVTVDEAFELSRFKPSLKSMIEDHLSGALDHELFPYTRDVPPEPEVRNAATQSSLRTNRPAWAKGRTQLDVPRQRVIAFMAGGTTYSEIRSIYEVSDTYQRDVILGSSCVHTPSSWIAALGSLRSERDGLHLGVDAPAPPIPLLEQKPVQVPTQKQAPAPSKSTLPPTVPKETKREPEGNGHKTDKVEDKEKPKKKFGLFGSKKK